MPTIDFGITYNTGRLEYDSSRFYISFAFPTRELRATGDNPQVETIDLPP